MKLTALVSASALIACLGSASAQVSSINSLQVAPYWYADYFGRSNLTITNDGLAGIRFEDRNFTGGGFANRHQAALAVNGNAFLFQPGQSFRFDVDCIIQGSGGTEAGIWHGIAPFFPNSANADVGQFVLLPDNNGEIAAFGGRLPFFSNNQPENSAMDRAARQTNFHMTFIYNADVSPHTYQYGVNGVFTPLKIEGVDTAGFLPDSLMGVYVQGPNGHPEMGDVDVSFSHLVIVPAPGAAAFVGVLGLVGIRRRR